MLIKKLAATRSLCEGTPGEVRGAARARVLEARASIQLEVAALTRPGAVAERAERVLAKHCDGNLEGGALAEDACDV